jgi:hypothetical protein
MNQLQLITGLFFLYLVSAGGSINNMLSCKLQKFIEENVIFRHIILLLTIYIFTFIVGAYNPDAIITTKEQEEKEIKMGEGMTNSNSKNPSGWDILLRYGTSTIFIYVIFLLTSKCELPYLLGFLTLLLIIFFKYIYEIYENKDNKIKEWTPGILEYIAGAVLLIGVVMYTIREYKEHRGEWNTLSYIFGTPKCKNK